MFTKVRIEKAPKLFFLFFENYFLFPFLYFTFARQKDGSNVTDRWLRRRRNNKQGNKHYATKIVGDEVILLDKKTDQCIV
jgi:hypothetical protein